jgi:hypothetical protein
MLEPRFGKLRGHHDEAGAFKGESPREFREADIVADHDPDSPEGGIKHADPVAGSQERVFLHERKQVSLPVHAGHGAVRQDDRGGVVHPAPAGLGDAAGDHDAPVPGGPFRERVDDPVGDGLRDRSYR